MKKSCLEKMNKLVHAKVFKIYLDILKGKDTLKKCKNILFANRIYEDVRVYPIGLSCLRRIPPNAKENNRIHFRP